MAGTLVTGQGRGNTVVAVQPGMYVAPVVVVTSSGTLVTAGSPATAAPGMQTGSQAPNAVVQVRPGMQVRPVVVVDGTGSYVYS